MYHDTNLALLIEGGDATSLSHMQVMDEINRLAAAFIGLQRSVEGSSFEAVRCSTSKQDAPVQLFTLCITQGSPKGNPAAVQAVMWT